ncbi:jg4321, partial [Pararge aegeria aegeria]
KEPTVPNANPDRVAKIVSLQRFNSPEWNSVRYTDIQKKYVAYPAFTDLRVNEELRRFEDPLSPLRWFQMERSFAALSNALLAQNECVNQSLQEIINWAGKSDTQLTPSSLCVKISESFGRESKYTNVTQDILQIVCGKRAEVMELRRRSLLKQLKSKYAHEDIDKIPPSSEYIFNPDGLSAYLSKMGGLDKLEKQNPPRTTRPKSPEPSTSSFHQNKTFHPQNKTKKHNQDKEFRTKRHFTATEKKRGGQKDKSGRKTGNRNK